MSKRYFGTDGIRGHVGDFPTTPEFMLKLGWAAGRILSNGYRGRVLIGKDTRISGYMFESALEAGLSAAGVDVVLLGPLPTPGIAYLTRTTRARAGIVVSASHNSYTDNGIKFFSQDGFKLPDELEHLIEAEIDQPLTVTPAAQLGKAMRMEDAQGRYVEFCKSSFPNHLNLRGLKIILDCAHGATYHVAPQVFYELGAEVLPLAVQPNGLNINAHCGSTHPENLIAAVKHHEADLGIALDGDGDRVIMVDHRGELVEGDEILFIVVQHLQKTQKLSGGVVGTLMTNFGFERAMQELGIPFARSKVGDRYVMAELRKRGWACGGENSGHLVFLNHTTTGDGIISALQVLTVMLERGLRLHDLKKEMPKCPQVLRNITIENREAVMAHPKLAQAIAAAEAKLKNQGRILIRPSGTEPCLRIMVEAEQAELVATLAEELAELATALAASIRH